MSFALNPGRTLSLPARPMAQPMQSAPDRATTAGCMQSHDLLRGQKAVEIVHNGATYRLQATRLGKLILTK